jgi:hypothetical protein
MQVLTAMLPDKKASVRITGTAAMLRRKEAGMMWDRYSKQDEFLNLQRTVDALSEQLREVQWELQHKNEPFWKSLGFKKSAAEFMSTVCNRRIRPNIKAAG